MKNVIDVAHTANVAQKASRLRRLVPGPVSRAVGIQILKTKKHSPQILFAVGVVGVGATVVTACRATLKLEPVVDNFRKDMLLAEEVQSEKPFKYSEKDLKRMQLHLYIKHAGKLTKLYGPSIILGAASIAALTGAHRIQNSRIAGLSAAYATVDKAYREYQERVKAEFGEEKEREIRLGLEDTEVEVEDKNGTKKVKQKKVGPHGLSMYARCFDKVNSENWDSNPMTNRSFIQIQQTWATDRLRSRGWMSLNEVYELLGFAPTPEGQLVGWVMGNGDDYVDFGINNRMNEREVNEFMFGNESSIWLDFNVDGVMYDKI